MTRSINTAHNLDENMDTFASTVPSLDPVETTANKRHIKLLIAHEDPAQANKTKSIFKDAGWITHAHRISSIEDLDESLRDEEWNIILAYSSSKMYLPAVIGNHIEKNNSQVHAIFLDESYSSTNALQIIQCQFKDYLTAEESDRLLYVAAREIESQSDHRLALTTSQVLAEANARSQLLMDTTIDAISYVIDGMVVHANSVFSELLQFESAADLDCYPFIDLISAKDQIILRPLLRNFQRGDETESIITVDALTANEETFPAELSLASASYEGESCTQIILRNKNSSSLEQPIDPSIDTGIVTADNNDSAFDIEKILQFEGKGSLFFASITSNAVQRKTLGLCNHLQLIQDISLLIREISPPEASVFDYLKESWVIVIPDSCEHDPTEFAAQICEKVGERSVGEENKNFKASIAVGISQYGIADMNIESSLHKAFKASAEKQLEGTNGFKLYAPKIDNAEGAAALHSALELNRFRLKYQPIIALQEQSKHLYEAVLYIENDAGQDEDAEKILAELGIEESNADLDRWIISEATQTLTELVQSNPNMQLTIPLTASAIMDPSFYAWISEIIGDCNLGPAALGFSVKASDAIDYEKSTTELIQKLKQAGHDISLHSANIDHLELIQSLAPSRTKLSSELTNKMSGEDADPELMKEMINKAGEINAICIASGVDSAGNLAQLWQTGIHFVQGSYLQLPLATMDYEFSDIS